MTEPEATTDPSQNTDRPNPPEEEAAKAAAQAVDASGDGEPEEALDPVTALESQVSEWKDQALRARADLDNFRKRMTAEKADAIRYANQSLFESLLPVLDNFHFGLEAARNATDPQGVLMGMEMVLKQFEDFLTNQNISPVDAQPGTAFDPNIHEAVAQENHAEIDEGAIIKVVRMGYRMGDRLVRAANVVVSKGPENA